MTLLYIIILLFIAYSILIIYYWLGWKNIPVFVSSTKKLQTRFSVIIPARNEEANIGKLLAALSLQSYPKDLYEVIVVDDHSTDKTAEVVKQFPDVRLIAFMDTTTNSAKKKALEIGIDKAQGEWIVTTDADCIPPETWLYTIAAFKEKYNPVCIAAPVLFSSNSSLLHLFQSMDFLVLQGITGASVYKKAHPMGNGANLAYEKKIFYEVKGFAGIDKIASGDDMLLVNKIMRAYPGRVHFLKSKQAIVTTLPMQSWQEFINQRRRWASKTFYYKNWKIFSVLLIVYLFNLSFLVLLAAGFLNQRYWICLAGLWVGKTILEFPFLYSITAFFNRKQLLWYFFFLQPLHIGYTLLAGLLGQSRKYEWKGRMVK